ncbi:hypothetical protein ACFQVA_29465 [Actinomadura keratinilytica]
MPEGTVKTRALRARRELRAALARLAGVPDDPRHPAAAPLLLRATLGDLA